MIFSVYTIQFNTKQDEIKIIIQKFEYLIIKRNA